MVLRCSLLGHDYGEPEVERERDTRGSEVVLTVEEYERCARCGIKNVISENTEVTSVETGAEASAEDDEDGDAAVLEFDDVDDLTGSDGDAVATSESDLPTDENGDPITDDAEILDSPDDPVHDRGHGEWPESEDVGPPVDAEREPSAWPESDPDDVVDDLLGDAATDPVPDRSADDPQHAVDPDDDPTTDDAVLLDADEPGPEGDTRPPQETDTGFESAGSAPSPAEPVVRDDVPTEFFCPRCSFVAPGSRGSLRPGDICPECRKGYLGERER